MDGTADRDLRLEVAQLNEALTSRALLGQATGIVAGRLQVSTETAWRFLRRCSADSNVKIRRVAEVVIASHDDRRPPADDALAAELAPILGFGAQRR